MSFDRYIRAPIGQLRRFRDAPYVPDLKYPREMARIIGDYALEITNALVDTADSNACATVLYNICQENDFDNEMFTQMVAFAVDWAALNSFEERSGDMTRGMRKIVENTCTIWRSKIAVKYQGDFDSRELSDRQLRDAKENVRAYEDIVDHIDAFTRSRSFEDHIDDICRRMSSGRGRYDDRDRDSRYGRDDRSRDRDRGRDREPIRGFERERSRSSNGGIENSARDDRFAAAERPRDRREDERDGRRDEIRSESRGDRWTETTKVENKQTPKPLGNVFPNVPALELDENMKREDHELLPAGTNLQSAQAQANADALYQSLKNSSELGVSNEYFQIQPGYVVEMDFESLMRTAKAQFFRATAENPKINSMVAFGCAMNPLLGLELDLDPEKITTIKQFKAVYTAALEAAADKRLAAAPLRQLDHMLTGYVNDFILKELGVKGLDISSYFNDTQDLALHLNKHYGKEQMAQYRDFEDRLLGFLLSQDPGLNAQASEILNKVMLADADAAEVNEVKFFLAPLYFSFTHVAMYQEELKMAVRGDGVYAVDAQRTPLLYARFSTAAVAKMRASLRTVYDLMVDLDGNVYRWFESATEKGAFFISKH